VIIKSFQFTEFSGVFVRVDIQSTVETQFFSSRRDQVCDLTYAKLLIFVEKFSSSYCSTRMWLLLQKFWGFFIHSKLKEDLLDFLKLFCWGILNFAVLISLNLLKFYPALLLELQSHLE
jgi:hypothetical protein